MSGILVIISTAEAAKAVTGMMYAANARRHGWFDEVRVVFFGPIEALLVDDPVIGEAAVPLADAGAFACRAIAERDGVSDELAQLGYRVEYVGAMISDAIKEGLTPLVF